MEIVYSPFTSLEPTFHLCLCLNLSQLPSSRIHNLLQNLHTTAATNTHTQESCKSGVTKSFRQKRSIFIPLVNQYPLLFRLIVQFGGFAL